MSHILYDQKACQIYYIIKKRTRNDPSTFLKSSHISNSKHSERLQKIKKIKKIALNKESGWSTFSWSSIMLLHTLSPHWEQLKKKDAATKKKNTMQTFLSSTGFTLCTQNECWLEHFLHTAAKLCFPQLLTPIQLWCFSIKKIISAQLTVCCLCLTTVIIFTSMFLKLLFGSAEWT